MPPPDPAARDVYTVTRLTHEARAIVEAELPALWIEGEISNLARPRSGHVYFSLKDAQCQVRCAMFRMNVRRLEFEPGDGDQVLAFARPSVYPERGEFQLVVQFMEESGEGALRRAFEALKRRLAGEGLFDADRKRPLPSPPRRIGVITSPTGAAVRDVLSVLRRRFPAVDVLVYPVPVQGADAAAAIVRMLDLAGRRAECDVLILARGGGSLEDLQAFNEESVARAVARSPIPVVTGVGHEVDFTIVDFVADARGATPSAAAELVTPDAAQWRGRLASLDQRLRREGLRGIGRRSEGLTALVRRLQHPRRRLTDLAQRLDGLVGRLGRGARAGQRARRLALAGVAARLERRAPGTVLAAHRARAEALRRRLAVAARRGHAERRARLAGLHRALEGLGPQRTLERGYAIVTRAEDGALVRDATRIGRGDAVRARLARGTLGLRVEDVEPPAEE